MKSVVPLECNPDVFNALASQFGVQNIEFFDIFSLDPEMLGFYPRPVLAILLVFPISERYEEYRKKQDEAWQPSEGTANVYWAPQTIGNACGTMAFLHATNNVSPAQITGPMAKILAESKPLDAAGRAAYLENSAEFEKCHAAVAQSGDTQAPELGEDVEFHYVCLTKSPSGALVELDGRRKGPIERAPKVDDLLDTPAIKVIQEFLDREAESGGFSMIALCDRSSE